MADLWDRLRVARSRLEGPLAQPESIESSPSTVAPAGWKWVAPLVAERTLEFPFEPGFLKNFDGLIEWGRWSGVVCFDTETTGLSGGAGTIPFLIGWATVVPGQGGAEPGVAVRQWFLRDMPGEADLIAQIDAALTSVTTLVSFNGASFDLPLLRSRWALTGREFPTKPHRDDLTLSRRLWKRLLESCRLSRVEEAVLGIERRDDVPGALVPQLWFDYLRQGAQADFVSPLEGVLRHHAQDVYSLLCLDLLLETVRHHPSDPRWIPTSGIFPPRRTICRPTLGGLQHPDLSPSLPVDFWGLLSLKSPDIASLDLGQAWDEQPTEAVGLAWGDHLKRSLRPEARDVWTHLWESYSSYPALEELLKWLEHREGTLEAYTEALRRIDVALAAPFLPVRWKESLEKRKARLTRRRGPGEAAV